MKLVLEITVRLELEEQPEAIDTTGAPLSEPPPSLPPRPAAVLPFPTRRLPEAA